MANEQNLIPFSERSAEEVREMNRRGGIKSGETRRNQKSMRELMKLVLNLKANSKGKKKLTDYGIEESEQTNKMLVAVGLMNRASQGDHNAVKLLCDIAGDYFNDEGNNEENENGVEINIIDSDESDLKRVEELEKKLKSGE